MSPMSVGGDTPEEIARPIALRVERGTGTSGRTPSFMDGELEDSPLRCENYGNQSGYARRLWKLDRRSWQLGAGTC